MKPGAKVDQRTQPPVHHDPPAVGLANAAHQPQQRRLACAVAADHPHHLTRCHLQRHVLQCPELLLHAELAKPADQGLLQRVWAILGIEPEPLADGLNMDAGH